MESFAARLYEIRRSARLTQQQLADCLGVDRCVYAMYESGKLVPSPDRIAAICAKCGVPPEALQALAAQDNE